MIFTPLSVVYPIVAVAQIIINADGSLYIAFGCSEFFSTFVLDFSALLFCFFRILILFKPISDEVILTIPQPYSFASLITLDSKSIFLEG